MTFWYEYKLTWFELAISRKISCWNRTNFSLEKLYLNKKIKLATGWGQGTMLSSTRAECVHVCVTCMCMYVCVSVCVYICVLYMCILLWMCMCICMYILRGAFQIHPSEIRHTLCQLWNRLFTEYSQLRSLNSYPQGKRWLSQVHPACLGGSPHTVTHPCVCVQRLGLFVSIQNNYKELPQLQRFLWYYIRWSLCSIFIASLTAS